MIRNPARWSMAAALLVLAAITLWFIQDTVPPESIDSPPASPVTPGPDAAPHSATGAPVAARESVLPPITVLPIASELAKAVTRKDDPAGSLQAVQQLLYFFRQGFGENPVGQNEDIVAMLLGENSKRAAYLPADCPAIKDGKLLDAWGTPYWFHPVSRNRMEVRSAGPDRDLFTGDDLLGD